MCGSARELCGVIAPVSRVVSAQVGGSVRRDDGAWVVISSAPYVNEKGACRLLIVFDLYRCVP